MKTNAEVSKLQLEIANLLEVGDTSKSAQYSSHVNNLVAILNERLRSSLARVQKTEGLMLKAELAQRKHFSGQLQADASSSSDPRTIKYDPECELLLAAYSSELDQVRSLQRRLADTSAVLDVLTAKVSEQHELSQSILVTAEESTSAIESATEQLTKAKDNQSAFRFYVTCWFVAASVFLIALDKFF